VSCYAPTKEKQDAVNAAAQRDSFDRFREVHGRAPDSAEEMIAWLDGNVGGARGRLHLVSPMPAEDAD
jgi:hypothetical protein